MPARGPGSSPRATRSSMSAAAAKARSPSTTTKALMAPFSASMRARLCPTSSRALSSPERTDEARPTTVSRRKSMPDCTSVEAPSPRTGGTAPPGNAGLCRQFAEVGGSAVVAELDDVAVGVAEVHRRAVALGAVPRAGGTGRRPVGRFDHEADVIDVARPTEAVAFTHHLTAARHEVDDGGGVDAPGRERRLTDPPLVDALRLQTEVGVPRQRPVDVVDDEHEVVESGYAHHWHRW